MKTDERLQELKQVLQTLALPVTGQVQLVEDDCSRVEVLASAFDAAHYTIHDKGGESLTPAQAGALAQLDNTLAQVREEPPCSDLSLRQSPEWRQIRATARESLVRFGWPLEVPPPVLYAVTA